MIQEHTIQCDAGEHVRKCWLLDAVGSKPRHAAIFLDGEFYVDRMKIPELIMEWQRSGTIPATTCLFVSHRDGTARHRDLTCSTNFANFIATDVCAWMRDHVADLPAKDWLIAGPSLGGLQAAFVALEHPQLFNRCLSQSGSFWWKDEWLTKHLDDLPLSNARFWVSVGDQETASGILHPPTGLRQDFDQVSACEHFAAALKKRRQLVRHRVYEGGHAFEPWKAELPDALHWLLS